VSRPVYSTNFYSGNLPEVSTVLFEWAGPNTYVLREIDVARVFGDPTQEIASLGFQISCSPGGLLFTRVLGEAVANKPYHWDGHLVLPTEGTIFGIGNDTGWNCLLSGYTLTPT
jgi:hypothetical protein